MHLSISTSSVCITKSTLLKQSRLQRCFLSDPQKVERIDGVVLWRTGPAVSIDTACSSALVATHLGRQYVASVTTDAESASALAAGVNLMLSETTTAAAFAAGMLTADGRCKTLDSSADGYVRSEACIAVLLTSGSGSQGAGAATHPMPPGAVLRATAVNQDGRSSSLTAPNGPSQQRVTSLYSLPVSHARGLVLWPCCCRQPCSAGSQHSRVSDLKVQAASLETGTRTFFERPILAEIPRLPGPNIHKLISDDPQQ